MAEPLDPSQAGDPKGPRKKIGINNESGINPTGKEFFNESIETDSTELAAQLLEQKATSLINHQKQRWLEPPIMAEKRRQWLKITNTPLIELLGGAPIPTYYGDWTYKVYVDRATGSHAAALTFGNYEELKAHGALNHPMIVRVHSSNSMAELFLAKGCGDCQKIETSMQTIQREGRPATIIFLDHDGRGNGLHGFLGDLNRKYQWSPAGTIVARPSPERASLDSEQGLGQYLKDNRDYHAARRIIRDLDISEPIVLSLNHEKLRQLHPTFVEQDYSCPRENLGFYELKVQELLQGLSMELKQQWVNIEQNKRLLLKTDKPLIEKLGQAPLPTEYGDWTIVAYGDFTSGEVHLALVYGELKDTLDPETVYPIRLHSSCQTNERFHAKNCECRNELHATMSSIQQAGAGVIIYLQQEGRGTGVFGKLHQLHAMFCWDKGKIIQQVMQDGSKVTTTKAYKMHNFPEEIRDFTVGALMLKRLGVSRATLYSNSDRKAEALEQNRIRVVARKSLTFADLVKNNEILRHDLADKRDNLGHSGLRDYADLN